MNSALKMMNSALKILNDELCTSNRKIQNRKMAVLQNGVHFIFNAARGKVQFHHSSTSTSSFLNRKLSFSQSTLPAQSRGRTRWRTASCATHLWNDASTHQTQRARGDIPVNHIVMWISCVSNWTLKLRYVRWSFGVFCCTVLTRFWWIFHHLLLERGICATDVCFKACGRSQCHHFSI